MCCENLEFDTSKDVEGLGGISLRLVGSEDVDLGGTSFSLAINDAHDSSNNITLTVSNDHSHQNGSFHQNGHKRRPNSLDHDEIEFVGSKKTRLTSPGMELLILCQKSSNFFHKC